MALHRIGVVGCGLMGAGITQVMAAAGYHVRVCEMAEAPLKKGLDRVRDGYARSVKKATMTGDEAEAAWMRIVPTLNRADLADCDVVIEAIAENGDLKRELFAQLDGICPPHTLLVSNTSSIPIHQLAQATTRPDRVAGFHFFNPVPLMQLIELVYTPFTSDTTRSILHDLGNSLNKTVVDVQDVSGFIVNRLLIPYLFDAVRLLEQGVADRDAIDSAMKLGCGYPMGPLTLLDVIGLDTAMAIGDVLMAELNQPHMSPPALLRQMVAEGKLGRKSGGGFYPSAS
jgi:3-hydroxybutyryl-CoA dehydrogenase